MGAVGGCAVVVVVVVVVVGAAECGVLAFTAADKESVLALMPSMTFCKSAELIEGPLLANSWILAVRPLRRVTAD